MKTNIITLAVCYVISLFAFGCGDPVDSSEDEAELDLGQIEQAITGASAPSGKRSYGVSEGGTRSSCTLDTSGQSCLVPAANKSVTYKVTGLGGAQGCTFSNGQKTLVVAAMQAAASATGWTFTEAAGVPNPGLEIRCNPGLGNGPTSTALTAYRTWDPLSAQVVTLTDTAAGTWKAFGQSVCKVDMPDILARTYPASACTPGQCQAELLMHAVQNCALMAAGVGTRANVSLSFSSADRTIHDVSAINLIDAQSQCLAKSRVQGVATQFSFAGECNK
jgi:hypothetical protein